MRVSKDPEIRRQEIIDAARDLFIEQGYENTSVDDIVRRVAVAKGLFYYYFPKKESILSAIADQFVDQVTIEFPDLSTVSDLRTIIRRILGEYLDTIRRHEKLLNITTSNGTVVSLYVKGRLEDKAIREVSRLLGAYPELLPLKYPELTIRILVRGLGDLFLDGVQDIEVMTTLIEEILGLDRSPK